MSEKTKAKTAAPRPFLRGEVVILPLDTVKPNSWNPNRMPPHVMESVRHGFAADGWLVSQALLVWATDETGSPRNLIIDGEHRWQAACDVGLTEGPMVLLNGVTELAAKALTVKLNQKRGDWDLDALAALVQEIQYTAGDDIALELGFSDEEAMKLVAAAADDLPAVAAEASGEAPPAGVGVLGGSGSTVHTTQFFFSRDEHAEVGQLLVTAGAKLGTKNPSDTVLAALRAAAQ